VKRREIVWVSNIIAFALLYWEVETAVERRNGLTGHRPATSASHSRAKVCRHNCESFGHLAE
jgi:hypothetical protein